MLSANGAPLDIVNNVSIYARPLHSLSHLILHPIDPLMCSMQISKGTIEQLQGNAYPCPLDE